MPKRRDPFKIPTFVKAASHVLSVEGGLSDHPKDPGGVTNLGVSKRANPDINVHKLDQKKALELYESRYWNKIRGEELPPKEAVAIFDNAVHSGPVRAIKNVQGILGLPEKGVMDNTTLQEIHNFTAREGSDSLLQSLEEKRRSRLLRLKAYKHFGKGWEARLQKLRETLEN